MTASQNRTQWFADARFGMFVHFGPYAVAGRHEWVMTRERMTPEQYLPYVTHFDPDLFDARQIARTAKQAGARYVVLTTKHHDGFCLWATAQGDYNSGATIGRDFVREFVDAVRAEGLHVGLYHSLLDWHHPDYTIDRHHPRRGEADFAERNAAKDFGRYRQYLHAQVRELLTEYGQIDYLFFDFTEPTGEDGRPGKTPEEWHAEALLAMCRQLQPQMIVNDRLGIPADLVTPEQYQPIEPMKIDGRPVLWEACQTINGSWGYDRDNLDFKSPQMLVEMLVDSVSKGGNLILNVGPTGRGEIDPRDLATFDAIGRWMRYNGRSIYGAGPAEFTAPSDVRFTQRGNRLYVHCLTWPFGYLHLPGLAGRIEYAQLLWDGSQIKVAEIPADQQALTTQPAAPPADWATLELPIQRPDQLVPVIEVILREEA